jgi:hypothetical protein
MGEKLAKTRRDRGATLWLHSLTGSKLALWQTAGFLPRRVPKWKCLLIYAVFPLDFHAPSQLIL